MMVLVGHAEKSFTSQINITKDITSIVQWVKDFSMVIISLYLTIGSCILIALQY